MQINTNYNTQSFMAKSVNTRKVVTNLLEKPDNGSKIMDALAAAGATTAAIIGMQQAVEKTPEKSGYKTLGTMEEFEKLLSEWGWDDEPEKKQLMLDSYKKHPIGMSVYWNSRDCFDRNEIDDFHLHSYDKYPEAAEFILSQKYTDSYGNEQPMFVRRILGLIDAYNKDPETFKSILEDKALKFGNLEYESNKVSYDEIPSLMHAYKSNPDVVRKLFGTDGFINRVSSYDYRRGTFADAAVEHPDAAFQLLDEKEILESVVMNSEYQHCKEYYSHIMEMFEKDPEYIEKFCKKTTLNRYRDKTLVRDTEDWVDLYKYYQKNPEVFEVVALAQSSNYFKGYGCARNMKYRKFDIPKLVDKAETAPNAIKAYAESCTRVFDEVGGVNLLVEIADVVEKDVENSLKIINAKNDANEYMYSEDTLRAIFRTAKGDPSILATFAKVQ